MTDRRAGESGAELLPGGGGAVVELLLDGTGEEPGVGLGDRAATQRRVYHSVTRVTHVCVCVCVCVCDCVCMFVSKCECVCAVGSATRLEPAFLAQTKQTQCSGAGA